MCTSLHYFFVACGHETVVRHSSEKEKAEINYFLGLVPYIQIVVNKNKD